MVRRLRNIEIEDASVEIRSVEKIPRVLVRWKLKRTSQDLTNLKFSIYRGESPEDLTRVNAEGIDHDELYEYMDYTANLLDLRKVYYYQVQGHEMSGDTILQTFKSKVETWSQEPDLVALYVIEEHLFLYRWTSAGMPAFIYKKKKEGLRCPECWDPILKKVTKSNCSTCNGTGFVGGYYKPIEAWMGFNVDIKIAQIADWGVKQIDQTDVEFTDYPELSIGDIILDLKDFKYWKIANVRFSVKGGAIMTQVARVSAINRSDIEYSLTVDQDRRDSLLSLLEERTHEPEF